MVDYASSASKVCVYMYMKQLQPHPLELKVKIKVSGVNFTLVLSMNRLVKSSKIIDHSLFNLVTKPGPQALAFPGI